MIAQCMKVYYQTGTSMICRGVKRDRRDQFSDSESFKNLGSGRGLFSQKAELLLIAKINGETVLIPIDKQFRKKFQKPGTAYATLGTKRLARIMDTIPDYIEVERIGNSYRVKDFEIDAWFSRL